MNKRIILFLLGIFLFHFYGTSQEYIYLPCELSPTPDDPHDTLLMSAGDEGLTFERVRFCESGYLYDYASGHDTLPDSLLQHVRKALQPYLGKWTSRVEVLELRNYNQPPWITDSATIAQYPYCEKVRHDFLCRVRFDNGIYYRFSLHTDAKGKALNAVDIPHGLDALAEFRLFPPCEIYHKAESDKYFNGHSPRWVGIDLHYSNKLKLMYYEVECSYRDTTAFAKTNTWAEESFYVRYIFYNAVTGEVIWKAQAKETLESGADWQNFIIEFPENTIINQQ